MNIFQSRKPNTEVVLGYQQLNEHALKKIAGF
jgi:hypothetical protein